ncbi:hypothetical protein Tco_0882196 [Tanacetum coccineum]
MVNIQTKESDIPLGLNLLPDNVIIVLFGPLPELVPQLAFSPHHLAWEYYFCVVSYISQVRPEASASPPRSILVDGSILRRILPLMDYSLMGVQRPLGVHSVPPSPDTGSGVGVDTAYLSLNTVYCLSWIRRIGLVSFVVFGEYKHGYAVSSLIDTAYWLSE